MAFRARMLGIGTFLVCTVRKFQVLSSGVILICLNAISKSRLAHRRCISRLYLIAPLPLPICSFLQRSLTPCSSSVGAAFPQPRRLVIAVPDRNVLIVLPILVNSASASWSTPLRISVGMIGVVSPGSQCEERQ